MAGPCACSISAQSVTGNMLSMCWAVLLLLSTLWEVWRKDISLQGKASDCQMHNTFSNPIAVIYTSVVSSVNLSASDIVTIL